jgi:hypothetical protein
MIVADFMRQDIESTTIMERGAAGHGNGARPTIERGAAGHGTGDGRPWNGAQPAMERGAAGHGNGARPTIERGAAAAGPTGGRVY